MGGQRSAIVREWLRAKGTSLACMVCAHTMESMQASPDPTRSRGGHFRTLDDGVRGTGNARPQIGALLGHGPGDGGACTHARYCTSGHAGSACKDSKAWPHVKSCILQQLQVRLRRLRWRGGRDAKDGGDPQPAFPTITPIRADPPFISPLGLTMTPALSSK
eukprot:349653-Chlamydomonas_euryale.AAC.7